MNEETREQLKKELEETREQLKKELEEINPQTSQDKVQELRRRIDKINILDKGNDVIFELAKEKGCRIF